MTRLKMHVLTFDSDGYCKEMARGNMSCVFISCQFSLLSFKQWDWAQIITTLESPLPMNYIQMARYNGVK